VADGGDSPHGCRATHAKEGAACRRASGPREVETSGCDGDAGAELAGPPRRGAPNARCLFSTLASAQMLRCAVPYGYGTSGARTRNIRGPLAWGRWNRVSFTLVMLFACVFRCMLLGGILGRSYRRDQVCLLKMCSDFRYRQCRKWFSLK
jgi:hypothetical protein